MVQSEGAGADGSMACCSTANPAVSGYQLQLRIRCTRPLLHEQKPLPLASDFSIAIEDYAQPNGGIIFPNRIAPTAYLSLAQNRTGTAQAARFWLGGGWMKPYVDCWQRRPISLVDRYPILLGDPESVQIPFGWLVCEWAWR